MCGLFGVIFRSQPTTERIDEARKLFTDLAISSCGRGLDATGVAAVEIGGLYQLIKDTLPSYNYIYTPVYKKLFRGLRPNTRLLMGHTRAATHGENIAGNAHPFAFTKRDGQDLIGTHNGVIYNSFDLAMHPLLGVDGVPCYENDSANLFQTLALLNRRDWPKIFQNIWGSFAVVFVENNTVHMVRNNQNPLWKAYVPGLDAFAYASELGMLGTAANYQQMPMVDYEQIPPFVWTRLDLNTGKLSYERIGTHAADYLEAKQQYELYPQRFLRQWSRSLPKQRRNKAKRIAKAERRAAKQSV